MKVSRIIKKFRQLDKHEERVMARSLIEGSEALAVVVEYLASKIDTIDKELGCTKALYSQTGDNHLYVASLLAIREANMTLLLLLTEKIELDVDQTKE